MGLTFARTKKPREAKKKMDNPDEKLLSYVLDSIENDFEDFEMVVFEASRWAAEDGIVADKTQIWHALRHLLISGEARAYRNSLDGHMVPLERVPEKEMTNVFYISKGKAMLRGL